MTELQRFEHFLKNKNIFFRVIQDPPVLEQPTPELERAAAHIKFQISRPNEKTTLCFDETGKFVGIIETDVLQPATLKDRYPEVQQFDAPQGAEK